MTLARTQTATGDLNMSYAHDNEGKVTAVTYPTDDQAITPQYNYQYDAMSRPSGMSDQNAATVVSGVLYGAANELLSMNYDGGTETRSYNAMFQLTGISGLGQNITYNFPAGANNGKIASQYDAVSGETVSYQYDSLNRLITASAAGWSQSYSYDGFGNLTNRVGTGAAVGNNPTAADPATNRSVNAAYDANGNMLSTGNIYDVENRLIQAAMAGGTIQYAYDAKNKRIWQGSFTNSGDPQMLMLETVSMFAPNGQLAATYVTQPSWTNQTSPTTISFSTSAQRVYFRTKLIAWMDAAGARHSVVLDRLGSVGKYYPYGEERNSPPLPGDQVKFATYTRDAATGNDYADQRYYGSGPGRFMSPDPYMASGEGKKPQSWNRYAYVSGDPVNNTDWNGQFENPDGPCDPTSDPHCLDPSKSGDEDDDDDEVEDDPGITCIDVLTEQISAFLIAQHSPLAQFAGVLVADAKADHVDPRLLVAISGAESTFGRAPNLFAINDPFGITKPKKTKKGTIPVPRPFPSLVDAIDFATDLAAVKVNGAFSTVSRLYSGNPGGWCVDRPGHPGECAAKGGATVSNTLSQFGGDPVVGLRKGDPNNLTFPCPEDD